MPRPSRSQMDNSNLFQVKWTRDGVVLNIFVCKLHCTAQFYPHSTMHHKKFVNLLHRTANTTASQNIMIDDIAQYQYCILLQAKLQTKQVGTPWAMVHLMLVKQ